MTDAKKEEPTTLGDALPREMARVRDEVMPAYIAIGPAGGLALALMRAARPRRRWSKATSSRCFGCTKS